MTQLGQLDAHPQFDVVKDSVQTRLGLFPQGTQLPDQALQLPWPDLPDQEISLQVFEHIEQIGAPLYGTAAALPEITDSLQSQDSIQPCHGRNGRCTGNARRALLARRDKGRAIAGTARAGAAGNIIGAIGAIDTQNADSLAGKSHVGKICPHRLTRR
jgi:hypothetical protein